MESPCSGDLKVRSLLLLGRASRNWDSIVMCSEACSGGVHVKGTILFTDQSLSGVGVVLGS